MRLTPINPTPRPGHFSLRCCQCGTAHDAAGSAADLDGEPFKAYYCWHCQSPEVRALTTRATEDAFRALTPEQKHATRVRLYGAEQTREIEARERFRTGGLS